MDSRSFLKQLDKDGTLTKIRQEVPTEYAVAGIIAALGKKPGFFEKVKESRIPVVAGLVSSKELDTRALNIKKDQLLSKLSSAIEHPLPLVVVKKTGKGFGRKEYKKLI